MKVCIDAGHNYSRYDTGAQGDGIREQDVTFSVAWMLKELFENGGIDVILTRAYREQNLGTNTDTSLQERVNTCHFHNCDYFISLHCNASAQEVANGTEVYVCAKGGKAEEMAKCVQSAIVEKLGTASRGVKVSNYYVVKKTQCPAILVELAFITNLRDSTLLRTRQEDFAAAIFDGFCNFAGIARHNELTTVNDIVWEYANRGLIEEKEKWLKKLEKDEDSYWLARKSINYIRRNCK